MHVVLSTRRGRGPWDLRRHERAVRDALRDCSECKRKNYTTTKNKKTMTEKLSLKKFCPICRSHTAHREAKV